MSIDSYEVNKASWKFLVLIHTFLKRLAVHLLETIKFKKQGGGTFRATPLLLPAHFVPFLEF